MITLKERIANIIDKAVMADMVDGRIGTNVYADEILTLVLSELKPLSDDAILLEHMKSIAKA